MEKALTLKSAAKLNLFLDVLGKDACGYHRIITLFERISLSDEMRFSLLREDVVRLECSCPDIPQGKRNLAFRAAALLKEFAGVRKGVLIRLKKNIPAGAGLGGGSSNAATTLLALNQLWSLKLKRKELISFARDLGADVPFFLYRTAFALGTGYGDTIQPLPEIKRRYWHVVLVPYASLSTAAIYKKWDEGSRKTSSYRDKPGFILPPRDDPRRQDDLRSRKVVPGRREMRLTKPLEMIKILINALRDSRMDILEGNLYNALENKSILFCSAIKEARKALPDCPVGMSGKGPTVFGMFNSRKEAEQICESVQSKAWRVYMVHTC